MTQERAMEILDELIGYLVELARDEEAIRILRNCGVTNYELVHDFGFEKDDVMKGE